MTLDHDAAEEAPANIEPLIGLLRDLTVFLDTFVVYIATGEEADEPHPSDIRALQRRIDVAIDTEFLNAKGSMP